MKFDRERLKSLNILDVANKLGLDVSSHRKKIRCVSRSHEDRNPSMGFVIKNNTWKCYACGASGSVIDLVMEVNNLNFIDACNWLYNVYGWQDLYVNKNIKRKTIKFNDPKLPVKKESKNEPNSEIYKWIIDNTSLLQDAQGFLLKERRLSKDIIENLNIRSINNYQFFRKEAIKRWGENMLEKCGLGTVGLAWYRNPILFPYYNIKGEIIQIQARAINPTSKRERFANLTGIETCMYNMPILRTLKNGDNLFICEGVTDCLAALSAGLNAIAIPGVPAYKEEYTQLLKSYNNYLVADKDIAGGKLEKIIRESFKKHYIALNLFNIPDGYKDFSEYYIDYKDGRIN